jgi:hypothetical protein
LWTVVRELDRLWNDGDTYHPFLTRRLGSRNHPGLSVAASTVKPVTWAPYELGELADKPTIALGDFTTTSADDSGVRLVEGTYRVWISTRRRSSHRMVTAEVALDGPPTA